MKQPHPLLVILLLLAMLPAVAGGSLTHLCACEGLMYIAGCSCIQEKNIQERENTAATQTCTCRCGQNKTNAAQNRHDTTGTPIPGTPSPGPGPADPHDCDYMTYQMSLSTLQAQLPASPAALLHEAIMPLPVWQRGQSAIPDTRLRIFRHLPPSQRPRPLLN